MALATITSISFRIFCYSFLQWIPGRQWICIPILYIVCSLFFIFNKKSSPILVIETPIIIEEEKEIITSGSEAAGTPTKKSKKQKRISDVNETVVVAEKEVEGIMVPTFIRPKTSFIGRIFSFLTGSPSASSTVNWLSVLINTLLLVACLDSIFTPIFFLDHEDLAFSRVTSTGSDWVKISARIPPQSVLLTLPLGDEIEFIGAKIALRSTKPLGKWIISSENILEVAEARDWTGVITINSLFPATEYEYKLLLPTISATQHPSFPKLHTFTTNPDEELSQESHFTFASSSCVRPNFPYKGPLEHTVIEGATYLEERIKSEGIKFLLFLGDFIYADVPFYSGTTLSSYHKKYRGIFASKQWRNIFEKIPILHAIDDHEIYNDYDAAGDKAAYNSGLEAFKNYVGSGNPISHPGESYFEWRYGDAAYFVMDTRSFRSANDATDDDSKTMLGSKQKAALFDWTRRVNQTVTFKFVVSSVPFMSLWGFGEDDTWAGFMTEREEILDVFEFVPNVIILSGDRHEFAAASLRVSVTEFSTSPLNQFYLPLRTLSQENRKSEHDVLLKYLPDGNSKFTTLEVDTRDQKSPIVRVKVFIDGEEAWKIDVLGQPLLQPEIPKTLGSLGLSLWELFTFKRRVWF